MFASGRSEGFGSVPLNRGWPREEVDISMVKYFYLKKMEYVLPGRILNCQWLVE